MLMSANVAWILTKNIMFLKKIVYEHECSQPMAHLVAVGHVMTPRDVNKCRFCKDLGIIPLRNRHYTPK